MVFEALRLEPSWSDLSVGDTVDVLLQVIVAGTHEKHLCKGPISNSFVVLYGNLPCCPAVTVLGAQVEQVVGGIRLTAKDGYVMPHQLEDDRIFDQAVEVCSGIGCIGVGLSSIGISVKASADQSKFMCDFMTRQGRSGVIHGNIGDRSTMYALWKECGSSALLTGGFSCQPWSALGDGQRSQDTRSSSLVFILRCGYLLRSHSIVLECVPNAGKDPAVRSVLQAFCKQTSFRMTDQVLSLSDIMPARRDRWWCVLSNPMIPQFQLQPLPKVEPAPVFSDLFPVLVAWPSADVEQLSLDRYESSKFEQFGGLCNNLVVANQPMRTALHGWANQLGGCPCGCRDRALSEHRLSEKGIFSALFLTGGDHEWSTWTLPCTRHVHPIELAAVHGMVMDWSWGPSLRGSIAALGQLASPVQAAWVASQLRCHFDELRGRPVRTPAQGLFDHFSVFFQSMQQVLPEISAHPHVQNFRFRVQSVLLGVHNSHQVAPNVPALPNDPLCEEETSTSQRRGRENLLKRKEVDKQPATGMPEPKKIFKQPASEAPELEKIKQPAEKTPGLLQEPEGPKWTQSPVHAMPLPLPVGGGPSHDPLPSSSWRDQAPLIHGGIPAFASRSQISPPGVSKPVLQIPTSFLPLPAHGSSSEEVAATQPDEGDGTPSIGTTTEDLVSAFHALDQMQSLQDGAADDVPPADFREHSPVPVCPSDDGRREITPGDDETHAIQLIHLIDSAAKPAYVNVPRASTVGSVTVAECALRQQPVTGLQVCDAVGCPLRIGSTTEPFQQLFLDDATGESDGSLPDFLQSDCSCTRLQLLYHQKGWVAVDEMDHYLTLLTANQQVRACCSCVIPKVYMVEELCTQLHTWAVTCTQQLMTCTRVITTLLVDQHWFPFMFASTPFGFQVFTTPDGVPWAEVALQDIPNVSSTTAIFVSSAFPNDCGFQSVAWMTAVAFQPDLPDARFGITTFSPASAVTWRSLFEHQLHLQGLSATLVVPLNCRFGGVLPDVITQLGQLLQDKGVPDDQVKSRADMVVDRLGRSRVLQLLRSPQVWRDLKAACNAQSPVIQLVLPGELQHAVSQRIADGTPLGHKKTKKKLPAKPAESAVAVMPNDITIPDGIFREESGVSLRQIRATDIGPQSRGLVVMTTQDAAPYLKVSQKVSTNGLALLILDPMNPMLLGSGQPVRFPAMCKQTSEPLLLSACLVQLGQIPVVRNILPEAPKVEEVPNVVIKAVLYRDELAPDAWHDVCQQPVKHIIQSTPAMQGDEVILDVWDRQFLSMKLTKTKPREADIYTACFRLTGCSLDDLLQESGSNAIYYEPRCHDGRGHSPEFKVVWLNKQDKPTACVSKQSTKEWTSLVRSGTRFGLRVKTVEAAAVHALHKPNQLYLEGGALQSFLVGPMPFGATRASITKVFRTWQWSAKPSQPRGKSADGLGTLWEVIASSPPPYEVYQMQHSDILISALPKKTSKADDNHSAVQGSARTIAALRASSAAATKTGDPWEVKGQDPWAGWQPSKQARHTGSASADQVEVLSTSIEKKVLQSLQHKLDSRTDGDAVMHDDEKVQALEKRMTQLEMTVTSHHQTQQKHNSAVADQLSSMQQTVDQQGASLQDHFDRKLEEQLSHIERLLSSKKPRTDWRCGRTPPHLGLTPDTCPVRKKLRQGFRGGFSGLLSSLVLQVLLWFSVLRVGEAANPGPVIGTFNPTGVMGKSDLLATLPNPAIWGVSETHLSAKGIPKFRRELSFAAPGVKFVPGPPAPDLAQSAVAIGGKSTGVGILSAWPCRAMTNNWNDDQLKTARVQVGATIVNDTWFKVGVAYGYAGDTYTRSTMDKTDALLHLLTERIVFQSHGPRILCGDFNHGRGSLQQFAVWRAAGFVEIQEYAQQKWGRPIQATGRGVEAIDQVWISREIVPLLRSVHTDSTWFPGHSILYAMIDAPGKPTPISVWRKPLALPWDEIDELQLPDPPFVASQDPELAFASVFECLEKRCDAQLRSQGKPGLLPQQFGRCLTTAPHVRRHQVTPLKAARTGEVGVTYLGENFQHVKWCRQLRRLQSLMKLLRSPKESASVHVHAFALWKSIRRAGGFPNGFPFAWKHRTVFLPGAPDTLPKTVPSLTVCDIIFQTFQAEFRSLEKALCRHRIHEAKTRRQLDRNIVFRDVAKPRSQPVHTLMQSNSVCVTLAQGAQVEYSPHSLDVAEPVFGPLGMIQCTAHEPGKLTLVQEATLIPGDVLSQDVLIGKASEVFEAFQRLWDPMWNKHIDLPIQAWDPVIQDILSHVPQPATPFPWQPVTEAQWLRRKKRSAPGPDGVTRADLLSMPPDLVSAIVDAVNRVERGEQHWPSSSMVGLISNLEKHDKASAPTDYRPITVLSQCYRNWGSLRTRQILKWLDSFSPPTLAGNRPSMSTHHVWHKLSQLIEHAQVSSSRLGGIVADVIKCFNTLPRPVVIAIALHVGLPRTFVAAWHDAVTRVQRRFVISGNCSEAQFSVTGYPEGDGLSIIAMSLINLAMHFCVSAKLQSTVVHSYVDNWELVSPDPSELARAYCQLEAFATAIDVRLDGRKTYGWALDSADRTQLRSQNLEVRFDARDLGGHVIYCKKQTMKTIKARIAQHSCGWSWLARSLAPVRQKFQMLASVMWPRMLHGISGLWIGADHCKRLRTSAMTSLGWRRKGASSLLQFGLGSDLRADPGFWCLVNTIVDFRRYADPDTAFDVVSALAIGEYPRYTNGPCGAFLHRLHEISWYWDGSGYLLDHTQMRLHILDTPIQLLVARLKDGWAKFVGGLLSDRRTFAGLQHVDLQLSHALVRDLPPDEAGLLRVAMNGTFFTRDAQVHANLAPTKTCPFCPAQDSVEHRHLACPEFHDLRMQMPRDVRDSLCRLPECLSVRGWITEPSHLVDFRRALQLIPDTAQCFSGPPPSSGVLNLFTDGSCAEADTSALRLASWAVCCANMEDITFVPVSQGGVPGALQTVLRAEIYAAYSAVCYGLVVGRCFSIWTDNQLVHDSLKQMLCGSYQLPPNSKPDHDLWGLLFHVVTSAMDRSWFSSVVKVRSHENPLMYSCAIEKWAIAGNDEADRLAIAARTSLPAVVLSAWNALVPEYRFHQKIAKHVQTLIIQIGLRVVSRKKELAKLAEQQWDTVVDAPRPQSVEEVSLGNILPWTSLPGKSTLKKVAKVLCEWMLSLSEGEDVACFWVSSAHLLVHFQQTTQNLGVCFNQATNQWDFAADRISEEGFNFQQSANWLQAAVRNYAKALDMKYDCQVRIADGSCFRCWTPCLLLRMAPATFWRLDRSLREQGAVGIKKPKKDFQSLRPFVNHPWCSSGPTTVVSPAFDPLAGGKWKMVLNRQSEIWKKRTDHIYRCLFPNTQIYTCCGCCCCCSSACEIRSWKGQGKPWSCECGRLAMSTLKPLSKI